jgi:hypothetical protein
MSIPLLTLDLFVASLDPTQREFFLARESVHERRYAAGFDACCRALGVFSELQSQSTLERLARQG